MPAPFNLSEGKGKEAIGRSAKLVRTDMPFYYAVLLVCRHVTNTAAVAAAVAEGANVSPAYQREPLERNFGANISDGVNNAAL